jgi:CBS domain-containing protein
MSESVTAIHTVEVHTVTPQTPIEEVMRMMTERRVRHAPVVVDGSLQGIVSIGDVVKISLGELEAERTALTDYITPYRGPVRSIRRSGPAGALRGPPGSMAPN